MTSSKYFMPQELKEKLQDQEIHAKNLESEVSME